MDLNWSRERGVRAAKRFIPRSKSKSTSTFPRSNSKASIFMRGILTITVLPERPKIPHTPKAMKTVNHEFTSRRERWQSAPEVTYREGEYIDKLSKNKTQVVVKLIDGEEVRGWIEYYDKDIIRITRNTEPNLFIYKNRVKYLFEDPTNTRSREAKT